MHVRVSGQDLRCTLTRPLMRTLNLHSAIAYSRERRQQRLRRTPFCGALRTMYELTAWRATLLALHWTIRTSLV